MSIFAHLQHRLHGALGALRVGVAEQLAQPVGDDLPAQAEPVLEPAALSLLPAVAVSCDQSRSTSSWSLQRTKNETASVNGYCGPPFRAMNSRPASVKTHPLRLAAGDRA